MVKQSLLIIIFTLALTYTASAQIGVGTRIDSLLTELQEIQDDSSKVKLSLTIADIYINNTEYDSAIIYIDRALKLAQKLDYIEGIAKAYYKKGNISHQTSEFQEALKSFKKALEIKKKDGEQRDVAIILSRIGLVYSLLSDYPRALEYYQQSLKIDEAEGDSARIAYDFTVIAGVYSYLSDFPKALDYVHRALKLNRALGYRGRVADNYNLLGIINDKSSDHEKALEYLKKALRIDKELGEKSYIASDMGNIALAYRHLNNFPQSLEYSQKSLKICREIGYKVCIISNLANICEWYSKAPDSVLLKMGIDLSSRYPTATRYCQEAMEVSKEIDYLFSQQEIWDNLSEIYEKQGRYEKSLSAYKNFIILRDSIKGQEVKKKIIRKEEQYKYEKKLAAAEAKQVKQDIQQRNLRNSLLIGLGALLLFSIILFRQRNKVKKGKQLSDALLLNILPEEVSEELKERGATTAKEFDHVTVLFTDFVDFTLAGEHMSSQELVEELHYLFKAFDKIIDKYPIEKIKTIGDAYLAVSGLPHPDEHHAENIANSALEIRDFIEKRRNLLGDKTFAVRVGIHSGSVVAGIVGVKKFAYDIWGDTVNTAARMEQTGVPGKINVSEVTHRILKEKYHFTYRGEVEAKNMGELRMYFLEGKKYSIP